MTPRRRKIPHILLPFSQSACWEEEFVQTALLSAPDLLQEHLPMNAEPAFDEDDLTLIGDMLELQ
jgi:hypothetical protein